MNLINREIKKSNIADFRRVQYGMVQEILLNGMNYLINLGLYYDPSVYDTNGTSIDIIPDLSYQNIGHYSVLGMKVKIIDHKFNFFYINIPRLIDNTFLLLNGSYYIPIYYISDEPIVIKEKSIILKSSFFPLTIYHEDNRVIFMGSNILLSDFFKLMTYRWTKDAKDLIEKHLKIDINDSNILDIIKLFAKKLNTVEDIDAIYDKINLIFFDQLTKELYERFYNIEANFDNILKHTLYKKIFCKKVEFTDLRYKRLIFIEPILAPFYKSINSAAIILLRGDQPLQLQIQLDHIVKHFFNNLDGNVFYDTVNGFSSLIQHKASFKNPFGKEKLPQSVSSIHFTHKGRLCTNSITNKDPGQMVSLIPDQDIDLRYGIFNFTEEEKEQFKEYDS